MRATANSDRAFWSKPVDAGAGWMDDLSTEPADIAETQALDDLAAGRHETDRVFHELRDVAPPGPLEVADDRSGGDEPQDSLPPAATTAFTFDAVTDDLLPGWDLGLG